MTNEELFALDPKFWASVRITDSCWLWEGHVSSNSGYGYVRRKGKDFGVHCYGWILVNGPVPRGMVMMHSDNCVSILCVRPDHVSPGTHSENVKQWRKKYPQITRGKIKTPYTPERGIIPPFMLPTG